MSETKKYFVFISYSSKDNEDDNKWAEWLRYELDHWHLPATYNNKGLKPVRDNLRKVFRDRDGFRAGKDWKKQAEDKLKDSRNLIVICSPNAARSEAVNEEIEIFIKQGKVDSIYPFIIDGNGPEEYFPPALKHSTVGGDVKKDGGRDKAFIKVVAGMLDVNFDDLYNRYELEKAEQERKERNAKDNLLRSQSLFLAEKSMSLNNASDPYKGCLYALEALPKNIAEQDRPIVPEAVESLYKSIYFSKGLLYDRSYDRSTLPLFKHFLNGVLYDGLELLTYKCFDSIMTYDNNGVFLLSCSGSDIFIWDVQTGRLIKKWTGYIDELDGQINNMKGIVCFGYGDDELIITCAEDEKMKIWCLSDIIKYPDSEYIVSLPISTNNWVTAMACYNNKIAVAFKDHSIGVYYMPEKKGDITFASKDYMDVGEILSIAINDKYIITRSFYNTLDVFDSQTNEHIKRLKPIFKKKEDPISCIYINNDYIVAGSKNGIVYRWSVGTLKQLQVVEDTQQAHGEVNAIIIYNDTIIAGYNDGTILFWSVMGLRMLSISSGDRPIKEIAFNGKYLSVGLDNGCIYTYRINQLELLKIQQNHMITMCVLWANDCRKDIKEFLYETIKRDYLAILDKKDKQKGAITRDQENGLMKLIPRRVVFYSPHKTFEAIAHYGNYILVKELNSTKIKLFDFNKKRCKTIVNNVCKETMFFQCATQVVICNYTIDNDNQTSGNTKIRLFDFQNQATKDIAEISGFKASHVWYDGTTVIIIGDDGILNADMSLNTYNAQLKVNDIPKKNLLELKKHLREQHKKYFILNVESKRLLTVTDKYPINVNSCVLIGNVFVYAYENSKFLYYYDIINSKKKRFANLKEKISDVLYVDNLLIVRLNNGINKMIDVQTLQFVNHQILYKFENGNNKSNIQVVQTDNDVIILDNIYNDFKEDELYRDMIVSIDDNSMVWGLGEGYLVKENVRKSLSDLMNKEATPFRELEIPEEERIRYYLNNV